MYKVNQSISNSLQGAYRAEGNKLFPMFNSPIDHLVVAKRKNPSKSKPINYLLAKIGKGMRYVSSLFPGKEIHPFTNTPEITSYNIEYGGINYTLDRHFVDIVEEYGSEPQERSIVIQITAQ